MGTVSQFGIGIQELKNPQKSCASRIRRSAKYVYRTVFQCRQRAKGHSIKYCWKVIIVWKRSLMLGSGLVVQITTGVPQQHKNLFAKCLHFVAIRDIHLHWILHRNNAGIEIWILNLCQLVEQGFAPPAHILVLSAPAAEAYTLFVHINSHMLDWSVLDLL